MIEQARRTKLRVFERIICGIDESESELEAAGKGLDLEAVRALTPSIVLDPGKPVDTLVDLAEEADLLVVGSRGLHGPRALGSVSERVGHQAPCSVLVIR
jgi:nucleotide-binding universal stress UspA family protein